MGASSSSNNVHAKNDQHGTGQVLELEYLDDKAASLFYHDWVHSLCPHKATLFQLMGSPTTGLRPESLLLKCSELQSHRPWPHPRPCQTLPAAIGERLAS
ncbi:hypothetical protein HAX54_046222 [Datura stramonium]|uniref:Uncharacterized protein n=1 Tax=Datura stramonium TaxID=4076 RepID=A0ABS8WKL7_DATST|nr:hypothetical protein [Datura stramonium]